MEETKNPRFLKAGTNLIIKPEYRHMPIYKNWITPYVVTDKDEREHATIGPNWMIEP